MTHTPSMWDTEDTAKQAVMKPKKVYELKNLSLERRI